MNVYEGYDCVTSKPDIDDIFIAHYGVKGMKWHKRLKGKIQDKINDRKRRKRNNRYVASKLAEEALERRIPLDWAHDAAKKDMYNRTDDRDPITLDRLKRNLSRYSDSTDRKGLEKEFYKNKSSVDKKRRSKTNY